MTGVKRECPFAAENGDFVHNVVGDIVTVTVKRLCTEHRNNDTSFSHQDMECQSYVEAAPSQVPNIQIQRGSPTVEVYHLPAVRNLNNNYLTPPKPCVRCQAGEPGHYSHIGR